MYIWRRGRRMRRRARRRNVEDEAKETGECLIHF